MTMRPLLRWLAGIATLIIGAALLIMPEVGAGDAMPDATEQRDIPHGQYMFGGLLILCAVACVLPAALLRRAVAAGCTIFCFVLAGFILKQMLGQHPKMSMIESLEGIIPACVIGAGTAGYAITGRFPSWLSTVLHAHDTRPAQHIEEDRRHCPRCLNETWHVARTFSNGERIIKCESCGRSIREPE